jgi:CheY-like chemotaxis protein
MEDRKVNACGQALRGQKRPKILVVEDDELLGHFLDTLLSRAGYEVIMAVDGQQGLAMAVQEEVALVLTDLNLPGLHGLEMMEHLRAIKPHVPIIVMSGLAWGGQIARAQEIGVVGFLPKPFGNIQEVLDLVAVALALPARELDRARSGEREGR